MIVFNIPFVLLIYISLKELVVILRITGQKESRRTVTHAPVVVSHTVSMEKFWARFNHLTEVLVLLIHFTMVT